MEVLSTVIDTGVAIVVGVLIVWYFKGRFDGVERRMDRIEARFDARFDRLEARFDAHIDRTAP